MTRINLKSEVELMVENIDQPSEEKLSFTVIGVTDYGTFRLGLTKQSLSEIKTYTGETLTGVYERYINIQPFSIEENPDGTLNITVTLKKENEIEARLSAVENAVDTMILSELGVL
jgi:hypothetical protein